MKRTFKSIEQRSVSRRCSKKEQFLKGREPNVKRELDECTDKEMLISKNYGGVGEGRRKVEHLSSSSPLDG